MTKNTKLDEKLDLDKFVKEEVKEPEVEEVKYKHKKDMIIAKRIIDDSIKDNLIP